MLYRNIPQFTRSAAYRVNVSWDYLEDWLKQNQIKEGNMAVLDLDPDFQRGHVWSEEQQRRYVEFVLRGGNSSRSLQFNCVGWDRDYRGPFVLVDGKQRLTAVRKFLSNELAIFGGNLKSDYTDGIFLLRPDFLIEINNLETRAEVLQWYLDLNTGGVVHTNEEIEKVKKLLKKEQKK